MFGSIIKYLQCSALISIPIYMWYKYYGYLKKISNQLKNDEDFLKKHNCVIMYKGLSMSGWPEYPDCFRPELCDYNKLFEPIVYFLNTAKHNVQISVMSLTTINIINALESCLTRNVKIQLIVDYNSMLNDVNILKLETLGAEINYYVSRSDVETIMHYKYAVKDCNDDGYALFGSINWNNSAFTENCEDITISGSKQVVDAFNNNFKYIWATLSNLEENDYEISKTISLMKHRLRKS